MKYIVNIVFVFWITNNIICQEIKFFNQRPLKNIFLGIAGDGGLASINHEKLHLLSFKLMISNRIGLGLSQDYSFTDPENYYIAIPSNISFCFGRRRLLFELGFGSTVFLNINKPFYEFSFYPIIGYRFQPLTKNKLFIKIFASLPNKLNSDNMSIASSKVLFIPLGINIGKSF